MPRSSITASVSLTLILLSCQAPQSEPEEESSLISRENTTSTGMLPIERPPAGTEAEFTTDFSRHIVPYSEIFSGGPRKDGIPAVDNPRLLPATSDSLDLSPASPLLVVTHEDVTHGYPLRYLTRHEIVNDMIDGTGVTVTWCPLCNSGLAFYREHRGKLLDFGTTGRLRLSNLLMYDRQTESWWQQGTGEAIAGEYAGESLRMIPSAMISWRQFLVDHPKGLVMLPPFSSASRYGSNPYIRYDAIETERPFLYQTGPLDSRLPAMQRVLGFLTDDTTVALPFPDEVTRQATNVSLGDSLLLILWRPGIASPLDDERVDDGREVGSGVVFSRRVGERTLTFFLGTDGELVDRETGTTWSDAGLGVSGELRGVRLGRVIASNYFWFSWSAFHPETAIYQAHE